jgi:23S rRNA (pseudouridine1915-N3)-methyltransferase
VKLKLLSVGRPKSDAAAPLVSDYVNRIKKFIPFDDLVLKPESDNKICKKMLKEAKSSTLLIAMDETGKLFNSYQFSNLIVSWMNKGYHEVTFTIGGADGLPKEILDKADLKIGLSKMTLPHRLARLILTEQIYRAFCIYKNVPYQK